MPRRLARSNIGASGDLLQLILAQLCELLVQGFNFLFEDIQLFFRFRGVISSFIRSFL